MFEYYTEETASEEAKPILQKVKKVFGHVPKLHAAMAEAPATLEAYHYVFDLFLRHTTLSNLEAQIVLMTANYYNRCHYCVAGHTLGMKLRKHPDDVIEALREGKPLSDPKLEELRSFTLALLENKGHVGDARIQQFLDAGYTKRQMLEIVCGLAAKTLSNYTNALVHTELDEPYKKYAWVHPDER